MPERTDHNEAMRLADRISPETDWYEFDQVTWCNEAAALLRQQAEQIDAELCNREVLDKMLTQCIAERDQLRAEVERLRELSKIPIPSNHTHQCRECLYAYTPGTDNEDCPRCGFDGADPSTSRTTHKETE